MTDGVSQKASSLFAKNRPRFCNCSLGEQKTQAGIEGYSQSFSQPCSLFLERICQRPVVCLRNLSESSGAFLGAELGHTIQICLRFIGAGSRVLV